MEIDRVFEVGIQQKAIAACGDEEPLFYFVMNRVVNFVGCTFKVIWLHIHSQGNASFTSVNADTLRSRKGKLDLPVASFYFVPAFLPNAECICITTLLPQSLFF